MIVTVADTSALAGSVTTSDGDGVDFDAACEASSGTTDPGTNYVESPGDPGGTLGLPGGGDGCEGTSTYDGSTETTDFSSVTLTSSVGQYYWSPTRVTATFDVDGPIPAPCSVVAPGCTAAAADLPDASFIGFGYKAMFQNTTRQTNTPYVTATRNGTATPIYGLNEHWGDGFHFYIGFAATFTPGTGWVHRAEYGTYDPSPTGGFFFTELGASTSPGVWNDADPGCMPYGWAWSVSYPTSSSVSVTVDGVSRLTDIQSVGGCTVDEKVKAGDNIVNVKGLSHVVRPADGSDAGRSFVFSDVTPGNSRNVGTVGTALQPNRVGLAYSDGQDDTEPPVAREWPDVRPDREMPGDGGNTPDTHGRGPRCWTYTMGGIYPANSTWVPNQPCHTDDDIVPGPNGNTDPGFGRGSELAEWWDTPFGFTA